MYLISVPSQQVLVRDRQGVVEVVGWRSLYRLKDALGWEVALDDGCAWLNDVGVVVVVVVVVADVHVLWFWWQG